MTAGYSTVWERRLQQLLAIRDQHLAEGLPEEARRVEETIREEWANKTGRHLDEGEMHVFEAMIARNAEKSAAIVDVLALPSRVATACFGTTPEELANALALAGGDAYVESGVLVEYAPGLYRMQMKYAPSEHENYWKYRLGVDVVADPFTYTPLVGQKLTDALAAARRFRLLRGGHAPTRGSANILGQVDDAALRRLQLGAEIEVPAGTRCIRQMMSDLSVVSGNEVALVRMQSGRRVIMMGTEDAVNVGPFSKRIIAHTHPEGSLRFSNADIRALQKRGQHSSVIISPREDFGVRLPVPQRTPTTGGR